MNNEVNDNEGTEIPSEDNVTPFPKDNNAPKVVTEETKAEPTVKQVSRPSLANGNRMYIINFEKVKTVDDILRLMKAANFTFWDVPYDPMMQHVTDLLIEVKLPPAPK